jgi:hypothetical protein
MAEENNEAKSGAKHPPIGKPLEFGRPPKHSTEHAPHSAEDPGGNTAPGMDRS